MNIVLLGVGTGFSLCAICSLLGYGFYELINIIKFSGRG